MPAQPTTSELFIVAVFRGVMRSPAIQLVTVTQMRRTTTAVTATAAATRRSCPIGRSASSSTTGSWRPMSTKIAALMRKMSICHTAMPRIRDC